MNNDASMQLPWYRHRWPWILAAGPVTVIIAGVITTWLAATGNTALVADDYYKQGLTINRTIERERNATELGVELTVSATPAGADDTRFELVLRMADATAMPARLRVLLAHPTRSELDRALLFDGRDGHFGGVVRALQPTHWKLVIEDEARNWRVQQSLTVEASGGH